MSAKLLKYFRIAVSLLVFLALVLGFFGRIAAAGRAAAGEFFPALLAAAGGAGAVALAAVICWLAAALIWGRLFCSFACPLGFLQDVMYRLGRLCRLSRGAFRPHIAIRNAAAGVLIGAAAAGGVILSGWLEPFSVFGRSQLWVRQLADKIGNLTGLLNFSAPPPEIPAIVTGISAVVFALIMLTALLGGRFFCNTLCPAGGVLALAAKFAPRRLAIDQKKCVRCRRCQRSCKAGCIDAAKGTLDASSCVWCGNCLAACKLDAITVGARPTADDAVPPSPERRKLLISGAAGLAAGLAAGGAIRHLAQAPADHPVMPPGAGSREEFLSRCTGCQLCVANCRGKTLVPAALEYGLGGIGRPRLSTERGYCDFNCKNCSDLCPAGALRKLTLPEKRRLSLGVVSYFRERCVVVTDETNCGACAEHCPTGALEMVDYGDSGLTIPSVHAELCIGCGACQHICPARPLQAVRVTGSAVQRTTPDPAEFLRKSASGEKIRKNDGGDFPF